jgi:hypothetical protein
LAGIFSNHEEGFLIGDLQIEAGKKIESGTFWSGLLNDVRIYMSGNTGNHVGSAVGLNWL